MGGRVGVCVGAAPGAGHARAAVVATELDVPPKGQDRTGQGQKRST